MLNLIINLLGLFLRAITHIEHVWLILMPLGGLCYGPEVALRMSINLMLQTVCLALVVGILKNYQVDLSLIPWLVHLPLCSALLCSSITYMPYLCVWLYYLLIIVFDTVAPLVEGLEVVVLCMGWSQLMVDKIEERPVFVKSMLLGVSGVCYILSLCLLKQLVDLTRTTTQFSLFILVVLMLIAVHIVMWSYEIGNISDVACISLYLIYIIYCMLLDEDQTVDTELEKAPRLPDGLSFVELAWDVTKSSFSAGGRIVTFIETLLAPRIAVDSLLRLVTGLAFLNQLFDGLTQEDESESESEPSSWLMLFSSPTSLKQLCIKFLLVLLFTSLVVKNSTPDYSVFTSGSGHSPSLSLGGVSVSAVAQVFIAIGVYVQRVVNESEE